MNRFRTPFNYIFIFLTGATALVYEVIWQRYLTRLTGNDSLATALILGIFLGGLSGGYALSGWLSRRFDQPVRVYAVLEAVIGVWGLIFPPLFSLVAAATRSWSFAPPAWMLLQGSVCTVILIGVPTVCMGGTVPLLTRVLAQSLTGATRVHARIYGANTAGAFLGVIGAGYFLVPDLGLPHSLRAMAVINLFAAAYFALFAVFVGGEGQNEFEREQPASPSVESNPKSSNHPFPTWMLYVIAGLNGAAVMAVENVMIRITNLTLGSSSYFFSLIVGVFVLSLAGGSFVVGALRRWPKGLLCGAQILALATWWLVFLILDDWPYYGHLIRSVFQGNIIGFWMYQVVVLLALLVVLVVPVGLLGTTLPLVFHELKRDLRLVGWHSGRMFSANAAGCVIGSMICGWLLFYRLDIPGVLGVALVLVGITGVLAAWPLGRILRGVAIMLLGVSATLAWFRPDYQKQDFAHGTFRLLELTPYSLHGPKYFYHNFRRNESVKFYDDGPAGTVAVVADKTSPNASAELSQLLPGLPMPDQPAEDSTNPPLAIMVNGKSDSNTKLDQPTLLLSADIPALWSGHRSKALVIGLGTGVTTGELALYPDFKQIDVAEISLGVVNALPLFGNFTHNVQNDPRVRIHLGDAFRVMGRSHQKWNLIISEPSNPWVTGVDLLFSHEFYQMANAHLTEHGLLLQWIQEYAIDPKTFGILINTVRSVFPYCCLYQGEKGDLLMLAMKQPLTTADEANAQATLAKNPAVQQSLAEIGIHSFADLRKRERMALLAVADQLKDVGIETLDRPRVHYLAGRVRFIGAGLEDAPADPSAAGNLIISKMVFDQTVEMRLQTNAPKAGLAQ